MRKLQVCLVMPAFNEEKVIGSVIEKVKKHLRLLSKSYDFKLVVINDGSTDRTKKKILETGTKVISHPINRGLGGALGTGMEYAKLFNFDYLITYDSDGQHDPEDIAKLLSILKEDAADVVIGIRKLRLMPLDRRLITLLSSLVTWLFFGIFCHDTQSGFRGFNQKAIRNIELRTQRMEVSSEFFHEVKRNKLRLAEVPIKVIYTQYSRHKGQSNLNSISILLKLILRLFR